MPAASAEHWLDGMADAALERNVTIQYCTATGFEAMQALKYPAVTNMRTSMDYRDRSNRDLGTGFLLAWALGLRPSKVRQFPSFRAPLHGIF